MRSLGARSRGWRIIRLCFGGHRALTVMYFGSEVVAGVLPPAFTIATGALVSAVARAHGLIPES